MRPPVFASIFERILNYGIVMLDVVNGVRITLYQCFFNLVGLMDSSSLRVLVYLVLGLLPQHVLMKGSRIAAPRMHAAVFDDVSAVFVGCFPFIFKSFASASFAGRFNVLICSRVDFVDLKVQN